jgi:glycosyltransferase involved in cell wall biosynthesis
MTPLRITIVLPFPVTKPVGGPRIMYEFANRFHALGHYVEVVHSLKRPFKKMKSPLWWKKFIFFLQGASRPNWFPLNPAIKSRIVNEISNEFLPDADIVFSTWWQMTYAISELAPSKGKQVNLIQDYEVWVGQEDKVLASYQLPVHHAVIAKYLEQLVNRHSSKPTAYFPLAIDNTKFNLFNPIERRNSYSIIALYSEEKRKGTSYLLAALENLKKEFPLLAVTLFGVYKRPSSLPAWINYYQKPSNLAELYNKHAIFLSASLGEGWALPPAEAMACGCAVVCTDIGGHADYAIENKTALLTKVGDSASIQTAISTLLNDDETRISLAKEGNKYLLTHFNWENSVATAVQYFYNWQKE